MKNVRQFHLDLLGRNAQRTPQEFWLTKTHEELYNAYASGMHGYSGAQLSEGRFLATLVLALALTEVIHPVYFAVPKPRVQWTVDQIEKIGRHIFRIRKGDKEGVLVLRQAFQQLRVTSKILELEEPERWVMFGFKNDDILPNWAKNHLLESGELEEPRSAGVRVLH